LGTKGVFKDTTGSDDIDAGLMLEWHRETKWRVLRVLLLSSAAARSHGQEEGGGATHEESGLQTLGDLSAMRRQ
jgi:hypothetical protein